MYVYYNFLLFQVRFSLPLTPHEGHKELATNAEVAFLIFFPSSLNSAFLFFFQVPNFSPSSSKKY